MKEDRDMRRNPDIFHLVSSLLGFAELER